MKITKLFLGGFIIACLMALYVPAFATGTHDPVSTSNADSRSDARADAEAIAAAVAKSDANSSNEGNELSVNQNYESGPSDQVVVVGNSTASCLSAYGFAANNSHGGAVFGWPFQSKSCNYEQNAQAADAQGNYGLGWFWRCHKKASYKPFKGKGESKESAVQDCHQAMVGYVNSQATIKKLREDIAFLENERAIERKECNESKNRIVEASKESTQRALDSCTRK
jgi:hypothetical protein